MLGSINGVERKWELREGISRAKDFSPTAECAMDPEFPDNTLLADNLANTAGAIIASTPLKSFLESRKVPKVEYLPITIIDHRGKPASRDYFIIHPVDPVDCLDLEKCEPTWNAVESSWIRKVKRLALDETRLPADRVLFRPQAFHLVILVRRELADAIDGQGLTGIRWLELDQFPE
jgi:hypothetical protein